MIGKIAIVSVITGIIILIIGSYTGFIITIPDWSPETVVIRILIGAAGLGIIAATSAVAAERIREIKKGEKDDLSKY